MDEIFHWNSEAEVTVIEGSSYLCLFPPVKLPKDFLRASLPIYQGNKLWLCHSAVIVCSPFQILHVDKPFAMLNFDSLGSRRSLSVIPRGLQEAQLRLGEHWCCRDTQLRFDHGSGRIASPRGDTEVTWSQTSTKKRRGLPAKHTALQSLQRRWTRKTTMDTRQYKGPGGQEKKREKNHDVVSLQNEVGTALQRCNFKPVATQEFPVFSDPHLHVICRWELHIRHLNLLGNYTSKSTLFTISAQHTGVRTGPAPANPWTIPGTSPSSSDCNERQQQRHDSLIFLARALKAAETHHH